MSLGVFGGGEVGIDAAGASGAAASMDAVGRLVLHAGSHAAEPSTTVQLQYVAASVAFVGIVGGLLYWYYGRRVGTQ